MIEPLLDEFDVLDVALAAVGLAEQAALGDGEGEAEIAPASLSDRPERRPARGRDAPRRDAPRGQAPRRQAPRRTTRRVEGGRGGGGPWATLYVGAGRRAGMRPGDLVGAITGEAGVTGASVGAIQIADGHSLVEVPADEAKDIARALKAATIKGRRIPVRLERWPNPSAEPR